MWWLLSAALAGEPAALQAAVAEHRAELEPCYESTGRREALGWTLSFTVDFLGRPEQVRVTSLSAVAREDLGEMGSCLADVIRGWRFTPPPSSQDVVYTAQFFPDGPAAPSDALRDAIAQQAQALQLCHERSGSRAVSWTVHLVIGRDGAVGDVRTVSGSPAALRGAALSAQVPPPPPPMLLEQCLLDTVRGWHFAPQTEPRTVEEHFSFP